MNAVFVLSPSSTQLFLCSLCPVVPLWENSLFDELLEAQAEQSSQELVIFRLGF